MSIFKTFLFVTATGLIPQLLFAQDTARHVPDLEFGKITPSDFTVSSPVIDSNTEVVILADVGRVELETHNGEIRTIIKRSRRMRILNQRGIDAATISIPYEVEENGSGRLKSMKAMVYNLEGSKVESTPLSDKDIFLDHLGSAIVEERFTLPNVKVGSIIEYTYTLRSASVMKLYPWNFQGAYPRLWSDFKVSIPDLFNYVFLMQGSHPLYLRAEDSVKTTFYLGSGNAETQVHNIRWVMKDVPALTEAPFTSTLNNYITGIRFQLSQRPISALMRVRVLDTWQVANDKLLSNPDFGLPISDKNPWLKDKLSQITAGNSTDLEKAKQIFSFVRDHFATDGQGFFLHSPLKDIFSKRKGTVAEINLLLVAMLKEEGLKADPVILSTRDNGLTNAVYPLTDNFNYVVVRLEIDDKVWYLDGSQPHLGFGKLPLECYNGHSRVITKNGYAVYLQPDSLQESRMTTVFVTNDEKDSLYATFTVAAGYYESLDVRDSLSRTSQDNFFHHLATTNTVDGVVLHTSIDSLQQYDAPVTLHYEMQFSPGNGDLLYFNPMFNDASKENPLQSEKRLYPVEMPYAQDEVYVLNMEIPKGYQVEELPKSAKVQLNETDGLFQYSVQKMGNSIQFLCKLIIHKAIFQPDEYEALRNFYAFIVKKQSEMIVFRKTP
jgi:hypothetical protein